MEQPTNFEQEWRTENRHIRQRLIGACIIFAVAVALWSSGDVPPPPDFRDVPSVPQELIVAPQEGGISEIIANIVDKAENEAEEEASADDEPVVSIISADESLSIVESDFTPVVVEEIIAAPEKPEPAPAPASDVTEKPAPEKTAAVPKETLSLQAGAFRQKSNRDGLEKKLQAAGFSTAISKAGDAYKLHIVNLENKAAMTAAQNSLNKILRGDGKVVVQIGAFSQQKRADKIVEHLQEKGFEVWVEPTDRNGVRLLRVRVGGVDDRTKAEAKRTELVKLGYENARVIDLL